MLFIPIFGDQLRNALKSVSSGNALILPFSELTIESFPAKLEEMLTQPSYAERAKELARIFNDNLVNPMDEAMFWIEYVMRSKGAKHLKSHAVNMPLFQYLLLDILFIPIFSIIVLCFVINLLFNSKNSNGNQKRKGDIKIKKK